MEITVLGIDLGKTTCSVARLDGGGEFVLRKHVQRHRLFAFLSGLSLLISASQFGGFKSSIIEEVPKR